MRNKFYAILHEDTNRWPNEEQACRLSTHSLNPAKFEAHIRDLLSYTVEREAKAIRLVFMATARSLMNVAHDDMMRAKYRGLAEVIIQKFEEYDGPEVLEFPLPQYVAEFKSFVR